MKSVMLCIAFSILSASQARLGGGAVPPGTQPDIVTLDGQGKVMGVHDASNNTRYWLNVPFAASTAGQNRFLAPQPRAPWSDTYDATVYGAGCPSLHHNPDVPSNTSEDCLMADVFAPVQDPDGQGKTSFPVVVWFYGGGFAEGSNSGPFRLYDGANMASRHGVVVVQPNYRLGALGFARIKGLSSGNQGISDQDFALRWVQKHVSKFGGDPTQVTIMGESAGAMSVGIHLTRPNTRGLFQRAIMESNFAGYVYRNASGAEDFGETVCQNVPGCWDGSKCSFTCLQQASLDDIRDGWKKASGDIIDTILSDIHHLVDSILSFTPNVDGDIITELPLAAIEAGSPNYQSDIPVLVGTNGFEGQTFVFAATDATLPPFLLDIAYPVLLGGEDNAKKIEAQPRYATSAAPDAKVMLSNVVTDYFFRCASQAFADAAVSSPARPSAPPTWVYRYNHTFSDGSIFSTFGLPKVCDTVACHASELPFVWGNDVPELNATFTKEELVLTKQMDAYWGSFVRSGDPNTHKEAGAPEWPRWNATTAVDLLLDTPLPRYESSRAMCDFWRSLTGYGFW